MSLTGEPLAPKECAKIDKSSIDGKIKNAQSMKIGYFLTEFGDVY